MLLIPGATNPLNPLNTVVDAKATVEKSGSKVKVPDPLKVPFRLKVPLLPTLIVGLAPNGIEQSLPTVNPRLLENDLLITTLLSVLLPQAKEVAALPLKVIVPLL